MKMALVKSNLGDSPAANLMFNERIRQMIKDGQFVYHFGFGQAPFPVIEAALDSLKENAGQNAYLPVQGREHRFDLIVGINPSHTCHNLK